MDKIGHQPIGMGPVAGLGGTLAQPVQIKPAILRGEETGLPVIATLNDVRVNARERKASASRHGGLCYSYS